MDSVHKYDALRDKIDAKVKALEQIHNKHLLCRSGCSSCCREYGILPVEFEAIAVKLKGTEHVKVNPNFKKDECPFLIDNRCSIYNDRPIICRTHGLPLLFMGDENWELSACELNFTKVKEDYFSFNNTYPQDTFNSELFMLNKAFLEKNPKQSKRGDKHLISIQELANYSAK